MASRTELKERAKACLRQYYWMALLACVVASILGGGQSSSFQFSISSRAGSSRYYRETDIASMMLMAGIIFIIFIVIFIVAILLQTFLGNVVHVGLCSYFLESRKNRTDAGLSRLFYCFGDGHYLKVVKVMFMKNLITFGWTLVFIIPGIIKTYQYAMVPYILAENPDVEYREALDWSRDMMDGHKFELFVLKLSFIGWEILGTLLCCIGIIFVWPYENATYAEYFAELKQVRYMDHGTGNYR